MTFSYNNPVVNCSGVLAFYRLPYVLAVAEQSIEQKLGNFIEASRVNNEVAINPTQSIRLKKLSLQMIKLRLPPMALSQNLRFRKMRFGH